ncbi:hypothetical protein P5673_000321 [Acropora cervicornis]|uniref:Uncharacterized protein n=1 Tax=Acropora cervicornis TaxID=6130 RepID=A0AAD9VH14_ACRCE|nr:hypothetical protein P5673_000321 [Acropora cervicornis]
MTVSTKIFKLVQEIVLLNNQAAQIEPVLELTQTPREEKTMALRTTAELNNGLRVRQCENLVETCKGKFPHDKPKDIFC